MDKVTEFKNNFNPSGLAIRPLIPMYCSLCGELVIIYSDGFACKDFPFCPYGYEFKREVNHERIY